MWNNPDFGHWTWASEFRFPESAIFQSYTLVGNISGLDAGESIEALRGRHVEIGKEDGSEARCWVVSATLADDGVHVMLHLVEDKDVELVRSTGRFSVEPEVWAEHEN